MSVESAVERKTAMRRDVEISRLMRVLILYRDPQWVGGVVSFIEAMRKHFDDAIEHAQFQVGQRFSPERRWTAIFTPLGDAVRLFREVRQRQPDVIHVNPSLNIASVLRDALFLLVLRLQGQQSVLVFWHGWDEGLAARIRQNHLLSLLFRYVFGWARVTVVLAARFRDQLLDMGFDPKSLRVESTMFDGALFSITTARKLDQVITLLFLSRMAPEKGVFELAQAYGRVKNRYPGTRLMMVGDGPARRGLEEWVRRHGISDVQFAGYLRGADKARALLDADLFVFPTYYPEGCPVSLLEAMAAGLPCITNAVGGIPDVFHDGENGILLNGVNVEKLTQAIDYMLRDAGLRERIGQHNRREAWEKYEASVVTRRIEALYGETLKIGSDGQR